MATTNQNASTASAVQPPANMSHGNASEIAWKFVMQYYKYLNKEPEKLHCFYNKTSSLVHGTEAEEATACFGQHEIHSRLMALGFQECKVFVHNLDSQSSAGGGIIIQVIGELQNGPDAANDIWHKFTQTFFLAEQTNGYYVLNDIFRYIREETSTNDIEESNIEAPAGVTVAVAAVPETNGVAEVAEKEAAGSASWEPVKVNGVHASASQVEPESQPQPEAEQEPAAPAAQEETAPVIAEAEPSAPVAQEPVSAPAPSAAPETSAPAPAPAPSAKSSAPSAAASAAPSSAPPQQAAPKPVEPPKPSKPKSWASLAGLGATKWGKDLADSTGISSAATAANSSASSAPVSNGTSSAPAPAPAAAPAPAQAAAPQASNRQVPGPYDVSGITSPSTFIKGVVETITDEGLKETLEQMFGPTTEISIVRSKACAFVEFRDISAAKKAVETSHLRGGIVVQGIAEPRRKVYIEEKKEKGTAGRGGRTDPTNRDNPAYKGVPQGRGAAEGDRGARGRGGAPARGRGAAPTRGASTASVAK